LEKVVVANLAVVANLEKVVVSNLTQAASCLTSDSYEPAGD